MKEAMRTIIVCLFLLASHTAFALSGLNLSTGVMALTNSTKQGGQGAEGSTVLTQSELNYHFPWWATGVFFQFDKQGSQETDIAIGPKVEFHYNWFYLELGYSLKMNRSFTDRSIAEQSGSGYFIGIGSRFYVGATGGGGGATGGSGSFLQFSYIYRTQSITKQDSESLDDSITQTDGYPLFGIGYDF